MEFQRVFERVFAFEIAVASVVFALVLLGVVLAIFLSRKRSGDTRRRDSNKPLEIGYAVLLAGVAGVIVYVTASAHQEVQHGTTGYSVAEQRGATKVDVTAFQWCWEFQYPDTGRSVTGTCRDKNSGLPTLVVPTGQPVELRLRSSDVVHALWIPDKAIKMDVYPHHTNTLTVEFDEEGRWLGRCAEFCGPYHPSMHFWVRAVSPQEFQQFQQQGTVA
ncbi:heme/copper-type cytochrome/quinol oxidase subunit 2 [Prauserella shujinwangii]|uniref:Cytochrome aa3 subunit 2 n=1 Tax=Prauserella shujinwangii TaxID=1453103 RepID=A0A2T0LKL0_9PSEU|nr:cytochrome c oxidase subunit II [Prauserella shujinwangii]PRX43427.1 heme/copper-type cytochrome/quinol oxidase subunit 2 [Prauserella shujinwangii]